MENKPKKKKKKEQRPSRAVTAASVAVMLAAYAGITVFINTANRPTVAYEEQRVIDPAPRFTVKRFFSGEFAEKFNNYYNDAVPERSRWKLFIADYRSKLGIEYDEGVEIIGVQINA